jgi:hypothetical protein
MKTYRGYRAGGACAVEVRCGPNMAQGHKPRAACGVDEIDASTVYFLPSRLDLAYHSPTGFEWGHGGSGPAQLALALLADGIGEELALECYHDFKSAVVAKLEGMWELSDDDLFTWHRNWKARSQEESPEVSVRA